MTDRAQRVGVLLILGVGLILRLWTLDQKSPWLDEASSWQFATSSLKDLMWSTSTDVHPPLYFLLLKAWILAWGDSLVALRALSVLGGMAVLFFTYRLATHFVPRGVANGYQTLEANITYTYLVNAHWSPEAKYTFVNLFDPELKIEWPIPKDKAIFSDKDAGHPMLADVTPMEV